jgi:pantetheine-phosphate adenylyltransferase
MIRGVYAGTFDPLTHGHLDIILRSLQFCNELVVAVGINPAKNSLFSQEERLEQIYNALGGDPKIIISSFQGLLVDYAKQIDAGILIRGIRSVSDFEYEIGLSNVNKVLAPAIETVFLPTSPELAIVSSSMVKEIARFGGDISKFVTPHVERAIKGKLGFVKHGETVISGNDINSLRDAVVKIESKIKN